MKYSDLIKAHKYVNHNKALLEQSKFAGCMYCKQIFAASEVTDFLGGDEEDTAECPKCGIDSVLPDKAGFPVEESTLLALHNKWFEGGWYPGYQKRRLKRHEMMISIDYVDGSENRLPPCLLCIRMSTEEVDGEARKILYPFEENIEIALAEVAEASKLGVVTGKNFREIYTYIEPAKVSALVERLMSESPSNLSLVYLQENDPGGKKLHKMFLPYKEKTLLTQILRFFSK